MLNVILSLPFLAAGGWGEWWLPPDYSAHGYEMDSLFNWIFWITMITFVGVELVLLIFLIKYRYRPERKKAKFTHGNTRLEMAWTLAPAVILFGLAFFSKGVWERYRYSPAADDPNRAKVLVIGEQFKWNVVYPGPDNELGRYLIFPKPTDRNWPLTADGKPNEFAGVPGPAHLPYPQAVKAVNDYIETVNRIGKDFSDPRGKDDDWEKALAREMQIPFGRPVEVQLGSKDVIHSFFLPNFRVKLDAVPGMRGKVYFTATTTSKALEKIETYQVDQLPELLKQPENNELTISITEGMPGADFDKRAKQYRYVDAKKATIIRDARVITPEVAEKLKAAGITQVNAYRPGYFDIVCEELCGQGHYTMQGRMVVIEQDEYKKRFETAAPQTKTASLQ